MKRKKTIIIAAVAAAILAVLAFLVIRRRYTIKGVVEGISGLTDEQRQKLVAAAEGMKARYRDLENVKNAVDLLCLEAGYTKAKAFVQTAALNLYTVEYFTEQEWYNIESELQKRKENIR